MGNSKKGMNLVLLIVLLIVFLLLAYGAYSLFLKKTADEEGPGLVAPTLEELENASYDIGMEGIAVTLKDGRNESSDYPRITFMDNEYAIGDLNADGVDDAAVIIAWSGGGSGTFFGLCVVTDKHRDPINKEFHSLGDRVNVKKVNIADGQIIINIIKHGPNDPMCCPTLDTTMRFVLVDEKITPL